MSQPSGFKSFIVDSQIRIPCDKDGLPQMDALRQPQISVFENKNIEPDERDDDIVPKPQSYIDASSQPNAKQ